MLTDHMTTSGLHDLFLIADLKSSLSMKVVPYIVPPVDRGTMWKGRRNVRICFLCCRLFKGALWRITNRAGPIFRQLLERYFFNILFITITTHTTYPHHNYLHYIIFVCRTSCAIHGVMFCFDKPRVRTG